ncbi:MAG TPA: HAMP domain-containing sensor histidine kinase [Candidatus Methylacidiphilales bacterium]|nr:HAMP domain-containing sensor histidine kinase [Candidatus Methylacidiphilales bacterium]
MPRSASIFLAAILLPSLVLAWMAVRSARDQQVLLAHEQATISQDITDTMAGNVRAQIDNVRSEFVQITQDLLTQSATPRDLAVNFDQTLRDQWHPAEVGFAVDLRGDIFSPSPASGPAAQTFREENDRFLSNHENAEVYSSFNSQTLFARSLTSQSASGTAMTSALGGAAGANADKSFLPMTAAPASPFSQSPAARAGSQTMANIDFPLAVAAAVPAPPAGAPPPDEGQKMKPPPISAASESSTLAEDPTKDSQAQGGIASDTLAQNSDEQNLADRSWSPAPLLPSSEKTKSVASAKIVPALPAARGGFTDVAATMPTSLVAPSSPASSTQADLSLDIAQVPTLKSAQSFRNVLPQQNSVTLSNSVPEESDFRRLIGSDTSGVLARFLDNKLQLMVWYHPSAESDFVFGAQLDQSRLLARLRFVLPSAQAPSPDRAATASGAATYCLALLDDDGHPVARSIPGFSADWKHPFVATEIGEALPHWEAALYLTDPQQLSKSARTLRLTLSLIVVLLVVAIVAGGSLIAADMRRQLRLAQQKTDFVSNVSHELKTPLTSIRMFADLLAEGRVSEPERQSTYLKIISAESARLTRLINNVLDFARQERGAPDGERIPCDLTEVTRDVADTCRPHLEAAGQNFSCEIEAKTVPILGDRDALSQIVLNLISNAEKYGGGEILVRIRRQQTPAGAFGCVDVLDRGPGIPPKQIESIFLPFHRLDDSLSSGIPGSGLGLTLARRMARAHGGDITYTNRAGGGSCFTLAVPLNRVPG